MVARDGIEPPTPAFSGPFTDLAKWFRINGSSLPTASYKKQDLGPFGIVWDTFASAMFPYCSLETYHDLISGAKV